MITIKTTTNKGYHGWQSKSTINNIEGYDWQIHTGKGSRGVVSCSAQGGKFKPAEEEGGFETFSFMMFQDPRMNLHEEKRQGTEKAIKEVHALGLAAFMKLKGMETNP